MDASKAFDLVNHRILFQKLLKRGLPLPVVMLLSSWYHDQQMRVRWDLCLARFVGVRQGSLLSPVLFSVYLDELLDMLSDSNVGCYWGGDFAGTVCYADDIVLLAPSVSALRRMLSICDSFATSHGLLSNADKTQLICFRTRKSNTLLPCIMFSRFPHFVLLYWWREKIIAAVPNVLVVFYHLNDSVSVGFFFSINSPSFC